jgi:hypothetical protein
MNASHRAIRYSPIVAIALMVTACAPLSVRTYTGPGTEFSRYQTYDWGITGAWTGDPRLDSNPFFHGYVRAAIEEQLLTKRIERSSYGMADLLVYYHASTRQTAYKSGEAGAYASCTDCALEVYDEGTLLIDLVDARTSRLVWRGWAEGAIEGLIDSQAALEERVGTTVARIFDRLPPRPRF